MTTEALQGCRAETAKFTELLETHRRRTKRPLETEKIQKVQEYIFDRIHNGEFKPGDKIVELQIAQNLGMSCIPVREAMSKLEREGWVERVPNKGIFVKKMDSADIKELFLIRQIIEAGVIELAIQNMTHEGFEELRKLSGIIESARVSKDIMLVEQADSHFHRLLVHFSHNKQLEAMYESILTKAAGVFFQLADKYPSLADYVYSYLKDADHASICDAIEEKNVERAKSLVNEHLRIGYESIKGIRALTDSLQSKLTKNN